jgi:hypothetical protein
VLHVQNSAQVLTLTLDRYWWVHRCNGACHVGSVGRADARSSGILGACRSAASSINCLQSCQPAGAWQSDTIWLVAIRRPTPAKCIAGPP